MSAPPGNGAGGVGGNPPPSVAELNANRREAARRRLALAQEARANATREEIEARGIRPNVEQIVQHINRVPSHSFKRVRLGDSRAHRIYDDEEEDDDDDDTEEDDEDKEEREEDEFEEQWQSMLAEEGLQDANMFVLAEFRQLARRRIRMIKQTAVKWHSLCRPPKKDRFDLLASLCTCTELIVEVCKHLRPLDIVVLYSVNKNFHYTLNKSMRSSIFAWAAHMAPAATRIYSSPVYCRWFIPDPDSRRVTRVDQELSQTQPGQAKVDGQPPLNDKEGEVRLIPGLLWLQMVVNREIRVRDIIASLARRGHRMPEDSHVSLKKMWLIMDAATSQARILLLNNPDFFRNEDLYIVQLFMVKLVLAFNDPIFGPQSSMLMRLMLGQRGLSPLWALLRGKQYRSSAEIRQLKLRYDVGPDQIGLGNGDALHGVEMDQLGVLHFEGWGTGPDHLMRPDELIPLEAARRQLDLDTCIEEMMIFGHVDFGTGNSLVPSLDEMYMSDDDQPASYKEWRPLKHELIHSGCGNVPFEPGMWMPKHARKARWKTLAEEEKAMIFEAEEEEIEETKKLNRARFKYDVTWANLCKLASETMATKKLGAKFKLLAPSPEDLAAHLDQFAHPQPLRLASLDAMDIDSSPSSSATPNLSTLALRPAPHHHHPLPLDPNDPSTIPDDDLILDPIPPAELRRIIKRFRPSHGPHSDTDTDTDTESTTSATYDHQQPEPEPQPEPTGDTTEDEYSSDDDDDDSQVRLPPPPIYNVDPFLLITHTPATTLSEGNTDEMLLAQADLEYSGDEYDGDDDEEEEGGEMMVLDQELQGQGQGQGQGQEEDLAGDGDVDAAVAGMGGLFDMDWDDFLRNPGAYAVEGEEEGGVQEGGGEEGVVEEMEVGDNDENEDEDDDMGEGEEDIEDDGDMDEEEDDVGEEEWDGGENINMLLDGGLHDGDGQDAAQPQGIQQQQQVAQQMQQQVTQQMQQQAVQQMSQVEDDNDVNLALYIADEDVGEDERTRKLRDWFRPW